MFNWNLLWKVVLAFWPLKKSTMFIWLWLWVSDILVCVFLGLRTVGTLYHTGRKSLHSVIPNKFFKWTQFNRGHSNKTGFSYFQNMERKHNFIIFEHHGMARRRDEVAKLWPCAYLWKNTRSSLYYYVAVTASIHCDQIRAPPVCGCPNSETPY